MILRLIRKQVSTLLMRPNLQADEAKRISQLLRLSTQCTLLVHDVLQQQMLPRDWIFSVTPISPPPSPFPSPRALVTTRCKRRTSLKIYVYPTRCPLLFTVLRGFQYKFVSFIFPHLSYQKVFRLLLNAQSAYHSHGLSPYDAIMH